MPELYEFGPIPFDVPSDTVRADLEFYGIDHFRPSYIAHIFFNDPRVTAANASERRRSHAGSFAIFGHRECSGDEGHCEVHSHLRRFDDRPSHPLTRAFKRVVVTDALRRVARARSLTVTVIVTCAPEDADYGDAPLLSVEGVQLTTFA